MSNLITNSVNVKIVDTPAEAPTYGEETKLIRITDVIIVGKGTEAGLPTVDLKMVDPDGNEYLVMATGAIIESIGGCVSGKRTADEAKHHGH